MAKLFSAFSLIDESTTNISIINPAGFKDESYFIEGLEFLSKIRNEHNLATAKLYKTISESATDRIAIREGFSEFFGSIKAFIKKIIDFIKKILSKFWVRMNGTFLRDKYIESHKGELSKFESKHEFDINGFTYTFTDAIPSTDVLMSLNQSISDFSIEANGSKGSAKSIEKLKAAYDSYTEKKNSNSHLDYVRKQCIGSSSNIDESDFKDELFKVYRNGDLTKTKITVTAAVVTEALAFFTNYDKLKQQTQRYSDNVEKLYKEIQKKLDKVQITSVNGADQVSIEDFVDKDTSTDKIALYDLFMKAKSQEIKEVSDLHVMAFSSKLDAINEDFIQSKTIAYGAFKKILAKNEEVVYTEALGSFDSFKASLISKLDSNSSYKSFMKSKDDKEKENIGNEVSRDSHSAWDLFKKVSNKNPKAGWAFAVNNVLAKIGANKKFNEGVDDDDDFSLMDTVDGSDREEKDVIDVDNIYDMPNDDFLFESGMSAAERKALPDSEFGLSKERKYPLSNATCVKSAIKLFGHCPAGKRKELAGKIIKAADRYNVEVGTDTMVYKYSKGGK